MRGKLTQCGQVESITYRWRLLIFGSKCVDYKRVALVYVLRGEQAVYLVVEEQDVIANWGFNTYTHDA